MFDNNFIAITMKILSITTALPHHDAECVRIGNIVRILEDNGVEVKLKHYLIKGSINYKIYQQKKFVGTNFIISNPIILLFKHLIVIMMGNYDIVYGNTFIATFFCVLGKIMRKPLILDMHGISEESFFFGSSFLVSLLIIPIEKISLKFSDKILCVSYEMIEHLHIKKNIPRKKLFYLPNGVDLEFFNQISDQQLINLRKMFNLQNKFVFGYIGGTHKYQGFENYIDASKLIDDDRFISLVVGCDIKQIIRKGNIIFVPYVKKEEVVKYYSLCDVLVLPRPKHLVTEVAAPTKFAEYTSMGKPILLTNVGDAAKLVKKYKNGLVIDNNDITTIQKGIYYFLSIDRDKLREMGNNSRKLAKNEFDWKQILKDLMQILSH